MPPGHSTPGPCGSVSCMGWTLRSFVVAQNGAAIHQDTVLICSQFYCFAYTGRGSLIQDKREGLKPGIVQYKLGVQASSGLRKDWTRYNKQHWTKYPTLLAPIATVALGSLQFLFPRRPLRLQVLLLCRMFSFAMRPMLLLSWDTFSLNPAAFLHHHCGVRKVSCVVLDP